jgi:L-2-hydroxyglutarate oxidase LhgO
VLGGRFDDTGLVLELGGSEPAVVRATTVINAAGLRAPSVSRSIAGVPGASIPSEYFAKGHYFTLAGPSPFRHLVYPVPEPGGLGIHVTLDLAGQARFGPDVSWVQAVDYRFDETRAAAFYAAIRCYYPALADGSLAPGYSGIRSKLVAAGAPAADFVLSGPASHGISGYVALYGIDSPGMTAALELAQRARKCLSGPNLSDLLPPST